MLDGLGFGSCVVLPAASSAQGERHDHRMRAQERL